MKKLVIWVLLLSCVPSLYAVNRQWKWIGPAAGTIQQIVPDRRNSNVWFAVNEGKLYRSLDGGTSWKQTAIAGVDQSEFMGSGVGHSVSVNPLNSEVFVITSAASGSRNRIWESHDKGETFHVLSSVDFGLHRIFHHPLDPKFMFGFGFDDWDLAVSSNGGQTWDAVTSLPFPIGKQYPGFPGCVVGSYLFKDLLISPFDPKVIYASAEISLDCLGEETVDDLFMVTSNGGRTWKVLEKRLFQFHSDPLFSQRAFAFNFNSIQRLTPRGWAKISDFGIQNLISVARHPKELLANNGDDLFRSTNEGKTWTRVPISLPGRIVQTTDNPLRGLLVGTPGGGVYQRGLNSSGWRTANHGFREADIVTVLKARSNPDVSAFAGNSLPRFLYKTIDAGKVWKDLSLRLPLIRTFAVNLAMNPTNPQNLLLASKSLYVTKDGAKTWQRSSIQQRACCAFGPIGFDPSNANVVYVADWNEIHRSSNRGGSFTRLDVRLPGEISKIIVDPNDQKVLYFILQRGTIYKSLDGGRTAKPVNSGIEPPCQNCPAVILDLTPLGPKEASLAIDSAGKVYRTSNGGERWERISKSPKGGGKILVVDPLGSHFFVVTNSGNLLETANGGKSWTELNKGFKAGSLKILDMTDPRYAPIYVGTNRGVFVEAQP